MRHGLCLTGTPLLRMRVFCLGSSLFLLINILMNSYVPNGFTLGSCDNRNHQKYREFYASKVPCNMVVMNDEGGFDMIKGRAMINDGDTPGESPLSLAPTPKVVLSEQLKEKAQENDDKESVHEKERTGNGMA